MLLVELKFGRFPEARGLDRIFGATEEGIPQGLKPPDFYMCKETRG
jgi:hypothetical protein